MSNIILGIATMGCGSTMPGATLVDTLKGCEIFNKVILIDGDYSEPKKEALYWNLKNKGIPIDNITVVNSPWRGSLKAQYDELFTHLTPGDWWVMLDDDEVLSPGLLSELKAVGSLNMLELTHGKRSIATARVTSFCLNGGYHYYNGEEIPSTYQDLGRPGVAGLRTHIYQYNKDIQMMCSPAGRHVVPYYPGEQPVAIVHSSIYHTHLKAPELYVINDCHKALHDHDIKDPLIEAEYRAIMKAINVSSINDLLELDRKDTRKLQEFALKYKDHPAPEGRLFILLYNILDIAPNPIPEKDWTDSLKKVLNFNWRYNYIKNMSNKLYYDADYYRCRYPYAKGDITL